MVWGCKDLIPTPGNGSNIHGRTWQQVRPCMRDLAAGPIYIEGETWQQGRREDETRPDRTRKKKGAEAKKAAEQAKLVSAVQQEKTAYYHNLRSSDRVFKVGEKVIVLIPDSTSKLFARWQGPETIIEKRNPHSFLVKMPDNSTKHIHQNNLRHYVARSNAVNVRRKRVRSG
ncbi:integrase_H2C2 domain-containing protein [Trichonephila clavata]|uniref:Integrase_H2C2 domain-containing protein n=1 Tax=Trichonephila clavata TaxID=2740835 RepID=A0A8X6KB09_TRICU|nr:integrase_H2C2 domain-containing protein [Trichonephila clavata]